MLTTMKQRPSDDTRLDRQPTPKQNITRHHTDCINKSTALVTHVNAESPCGMQPMNDKDTSKAGV